VGARFRKPIVHEASAAYAALARERGISLVQLALGYVKSRWYLGAMIIGATNMAQLEENIAAGQFELDGPTLADIAALQIRYPNPAG
jgi:aryl-alcohol dehydrogenase-like predicted oxidoreductase